mmetsp:Transcript_32802/g.55308  ORF Transcript_32802/g.55308 Transcript_32802/m.55308 type:complete len:136 (-) Transcript_32802:2214-2621(-)
MNAAFNHGSQGNFFNTLDDTPAAESSELPKSNAPEGTGQAIREAARTGNIHELSKFVEKWRNDPIINDEDEIGTTPLHTAASNGNRDCVILLLSNGADKERKNHYGQTAYTKAAANVKDLVKPKNMEQETFCTIM